jgi:hypothetical protein
LGAPTLVDGGFNGWWVEPGTTDVVVDWRPGRLLWVAIALSAAATLSAIGLVARRRVVGGARAVGEHATAGWSDGPVPAPWRTPTPLSGIAVVVAWTAPAALLVGPGWGLLAGLGGAVAHRHRTVPLAALGALATVATVGVGVVALELRRAPAHDLGWPAAFEPLHGFGMLAFALLVTSVVTDSDSAPMRLSRGAGAGTPDAAGDATG